MNMCSYFEKYPRQILTNERTKNRAYGGSASVLRIFTERIIGFAPWPAIRLKCINKQLPEEIAEHLLGVPGEGAELAGDVGQRPVGHPLQLVRN